jgi:phosphate transport system permease protein
MTKRNQQTIAFGLLWTAAALTMLIMVFIIGYVLFRGFHSDETRDSLVVDHWETRLELGEGAAALSAMVIVHPGLRVSDLSLPDLQDVFSGAIGDWVKLSEQSLELRTFIQDIPPASRVLVRDTFLDPDSEFDRSVVFQRDAEAVVRSVAATPGALGLVFNAEPAEGNGVKPIPIGRYCAAVHPSVVELVNNRKLRALGVKALEGILAGTIVNWKEVGGPDLPLNLVRDPEKTAERIAATQGAIGILAYDKAERAKLPVLKVERRKQGPNLSLAYFVEPPLKSGKVGGVSSIIVNTLFMILLTLAFSTPIGLAAAVYLVEYAKQGRLVRILRLGTETLAGIPSIIFGLFGMLFFVTLLRLKIGLLSGSLTLTLMILPTIIRTTEEALKAVPRGLRDGSLALGATQLQTIVRVVLPAASAGILTGIILAVGRAVGETAALIFTMGADYRMASDLFSSTRVLSVHLYLLIAEGISFDRAFAAAAILIFIVLTVNLTATQLIKRMNKAAGN